MSSTINPIPEGFHTATPYLMVRDAGNAVAFYKRAFGAIELTRNADANGTVFNVEIKIGDAPIMIGAHPEVSITGQQSMDDLPRVSIYLYVPDVDTLVAQAISAGAKELYAVQNQSYGNREGGLVDPFGIVWWVATRIAVDTTAVKGETERSNHGG